VIQDIVSYHHDGKHVQLTMGNDNPVSFTFHAGSKTNAEEIIAKIEKGKRLLNDAKVNNYLRSWIVLLLVN
jgi:hypothetical protein